MDFFLYMIGATDNLLPTIYNIQCDTLYHVQEAIRITVDTHKVLFSFEGLWKSTCTVIYCVTFLVTIDGQ